MDDEEKTKEQLLDEVVKLRQQVAESGAMKTEHKQMAAALERRAAQLALLNDIGSRIAAVLELGTVLNRAARLVQESFGYYHVAIFTVDGKRDELVMRAKSGNFTNLYPLDHRLKWGQGMVGWVSQHGRTLLANDVSAEPHYVNLYPELIPTRSELSVPIRLGENVLGVLDIQSPQLNAFDQNDVMVLETLADQIAVAMENASLYEAAQQELAERKRAEETLRSIALGVSAATGEAFFRSLVRHLATALGVEYALVGELTGKSLESIKAIAVWSHGEIVDNFEYLLADTPSQNVASQQLCCYPHHVQQQFPSDRMLAEMGAESYVGSPLFDSTGRSLGILAIMDSKPLRNPQLAESTLRIFVVRASAELERMRTEQTLQESETKYRMLFDASTDAIFLETLEGRVLDCNAIACEMFGYTKEELTRLTVADLVPEEVVATLLDVITEELTTGGIFFETANKRRDGTVFPVEVSTRLITLEGAQQVMVYVRDITERKQVEESLKKSEEKFSKAFQASPASISITRLSDWRLVEVNEAFEKLTGYRRDQVIGHTMRELGLWADPKDQVRILQTLATEGRMYNQEYQFRTQDGDLITCRYAAEKIELGGEPCVLVALVDLTERKRAEEALRESEERYRGVYDTAPLAFVLWDRDSRVTDWNVQAERLFGWSRSEVLGLDFFEFLIPEPQRPKVEDVVSSLLQGKLPTHSINENLTKSGQVILCEWNNAPQKDSNGNVVGAISLGLDITKRKQAEEEIRWRAETLAALHETALDLAAQRDLPDLLQAIVARATGLLKAKGGDIYLYRPESDDLELVFSYRLQPAFFGAVLRRGEGLSGKVLDSGRSMAVADYSQWEGRAAQFEGANFAATVAVPIAWGSRTLGILNLLDDAPRTFSPADVALLERFTPLAAAAMENTRLLAAEREQRELAETLRDVASVLNTSLDREQVLTLILQELARVVVYDNASVMLVSDGTLQTVAHQGFDSAGPPLPPLPIAALRHVEEVLERQVPGIIPDVTVEERWHQQPKGQKVRCWLGVPLLVQNQAIGLLNLGHKQPGFYTERDALIAQTFAHHAAIAIENARLFQAEQQRRQEAEALRQASLVLGSSLDRDWVLGQLLEQIGSVIPYDSANVMWVEEGVARITHQRGSERGGTAEATAALRLVVNDIPNLQRMFTTHRAHVVPDTWIDPEWARFELTRWIRSWVGAPIIVQEEVIAFLSADSATPGLYTPDHAALLTAFAAHAALAIENAHFFAITQAAYDELKQTQSQLIQSQTQVIQSAKMAAIGGLAAGVAHELNNPLTSVLGFAELALRSAAPDDPLREDLSIIIAEARRARDIVQDLLAFSRQTESFYEKADVNQAIQDTLALVRRQMEKNHILLVEQYATDLPSLSLAVGQMKQVFLNLITNARHAMPHGGTLTISSERVEDEVAVRIADSGMGIPADHLSRLFEPFFTTKPAEKGTGLGLSVSLGIVQEHGGRIQVESQVGKGSTFTVWLPVQ
jgi:PAS domain S-box-containing protein